MGNKELIQALGEAWSNGDAAAYVAAFHEQGIVVHPYFKHPIMPRVAIEVVGATVKGKTLLKRADLVSGAGDGRQDMYRLVFEETGDAAEYDPVHIGHIVMLAEIVHQKIACLTVLGVEVNSGTGPNPRPEYVKRDIGRPTSREIAELLGRSWGANDMQMYVSLFAEDALIEHVAFSEEVPVHVVADVMNCNVSGSTELRAFALLQGDGSGANDVVEMQFEERGSEVGYSPAVVGHMSVTATIRGHRIARLHVHGVHVSDESTAPSIGAAAAQSSVHQPKVDPDGE